MNRNMYKEAQQKSCSKLRRPLEELSQFFYEEKLLKQEEE